MFNKSLKILNPQMLSPENEFWDGDQQKVIQVEWHLSKLVPQKIKKCSVSVSHSLVAGHLAILFKVVSAQHPSGLPGWL